MGAPAMNFFKAKIRQDGNRLFIEGGAFKVPVVADKKAYHNYVDKSL